ncbi:hypothetical protein EUX98_g6464 [Antrodiella citrinella]|uniref:Uncharacterized protein n=1 Tax=Antrodiella citrinella TaxID=2447956 RepID=A0A4S4MRH9_9APHY|nr:hypothetical protein EUX98_g6464 [Antrodiella citrinella]
MDPSPDPTIRLALQQLIIPPSFATTSDDGEQHIVQHDTWLQDASSALEGLQQYLTSQPTLSLEDDAQIVVGCAPFQVGRPWASAIASNVASNILQRYASPDVSLVRTILSNHVKPTFQGNPHPLVNMNTGRKLPTRLGGAMAQLDYLENQVWKEAVGVVDVISWCMSNMEASVYEQLWPFVVPPIMTLLDDHEVQYKLQGVLLTKILIARAPPELLRRTGVDGLIFSSMKKCMTFLHNPMTPALLRAVIPVSVTLIEAITPPGSAPRFSQLCEVLGDGIIGSVWSYSSTDPASIEATLETLPVMIEALGIAVARYLKVWLPYGFIRPADPRSVRLSFRNWYMRSAPLQRTRPLLIFGFSRSGVLSR